MADVSKISLNGTDYNVKDTSKELLHWTGTKAQLDTLPLTAGKTYETTDSNGIYKDIDNGGTVERIKIAGVGGGSGTITDVQVDGVSVVTGTVANIKPTIESGNSTDYLVIAQSGLSPDPSPTVGKDTIVLYTDSSAGQVNNVLVNGTSVVTDNVAAIDLLNLVYPVGSIYTSVNSTNPSSIFGGTWESFGAGRTLVGVDTTQTEFDTAEETGGEKTHTLTTEEIPTHHHTVVHTYIPNGSSTVWGTDVIRSGGSIENTDDVGGGAAHNNLQPYITVYFWKRTA